MISNDELDRIEQKAVGEAKAHSFLMPEAWGRTARLIAILRDRFPMVRDGGDAN